MRTLAVLLFIAAILFGLAGHSVFAQTAGSREELESRIRAKSDELERLNRDLALTEEQLRTTKSERLTLQNELGKLQSNINQLELSIKADGVAMERLGFEVESIGYDIRDIQLSVVEKREAIGYLFRRVQQNERENLLAIFLKNGSLAESAFEAQSIENLRAQLRVDIANLGELENQLNDKLRETSQKKIEIETRKQNQTYRKAIIEDQKQARSTVLAETKNKESAYEKQITDLQKQQDAIEDEITAIEDELRAKFNVSLLPAKNSGLFSWPVVLTKDGGLGRLTQHFGERSALYRGRPHNGVDIGAPIGTPVMVADDGVVVAVDNNDTSAYRRYQYGKYVVIRHANNLATLYAHLSQQAVSVGKTVHRGEVIGYVGRTGYATGPHVHLGAYWAPSIEYKRIPPAAGFVPVGVLVNPEDYLPD